MITDEKADMEEKVEELKMERELHSTMQENLIQQIEQLQVKFSYFYFIKLF